MYKVACHDKLMPSVVRWIQEVSSTLQHAIPETERECFPDKIITVYVHSWLKTVLK